MFFDDDNTEDAAPAEGTTEAPAEGEGEEKKEGGCCGGDCS